MPRLKKGAVAPGYCRHRRTDRGYVTLNAKQHFLPGKFGSAESRAAYDRLIATYLTNGRTIPAVAAADTGPTITTIIADFRKWAEKTYVNAGGVATGEAENYRPVMRALRRLYGSDPAREFDSVKLMEFRAAMLLPQKETDPKDPTKTIERPGWSRTYCNRQIDRVRFVFRWAVTRRLIPKNDAYQSLTEVASIRRGREGARETEAVRPACEADVIATIEKLSPPLAALVKIQMLTGARCGELFKLRPIDIDTAGEVWKVRLAEHKTAHHGHARTLRFGPKAQAVLSTFLTRPTTAFLFTPAENVAWYREQARLNRKSKVQPSQVARSAAAAKRERKLRPHFDRISYGQAITRACRKADVPHWHPHQLRHLAGTVYRREADFEAAKIVLGHSTDSMTESYAERDERKAEAIVARIG